MTVDTLELPKTQTECLPVPESLQDVWEHADIIVVECQRIALDDEHIPTVFENLTRLYAFNQNGTLARYYRNLCISYAAFRLRILISEQIMI